MERSSTLVAAGVITAAAWLLAQVNGAKDEQSVAVVEQAPAVTISKLEHTSSQLALTQRFGARAPARPGFETRTGPGGSKFISVTR